jgi:mannose-1-phosphate guanylyltransferase
MERASPNRTETAPATPSRPGEAWALVLAGGDGSRLSSLTTDGTGNVVPKQFCSLAGDDSLVAQTLRRAGVLVPRERITAIVSSRHERHWRSSLRDLPSRNVVVQPGNRGTAIGILLPLLRILARDPEARILLLPSDHYVHDELKLARTLRSVLGGIAAHPRGVVMLGIEAEHADPELGYIVAGSADRAGFRDVRRFVEKPPPEDARRLCEAGALWNSFIIACRASSLLHLFRSRCPDVLAMLQGCDIHDQAALESVYARLPTIDFSRDIAAGQEAHLAVAAVPRCGWSDLGTPQRLAETLGRFRGRWAGGPSRRPGTYVNLAERLARDAPGLPQAAAARSAHA